MRGSVYYQSAELTKTFKSSIIFLRFDKKLNLYTFVKLTKLFWCTHLSNFIFVFKWLLSFTYCKFYQWFIKYPNWCYDKQTHTWFSLAYLTISTPYLSLIFISFSFSALYFRSFSYSITEKVFILWFVAKFDALIAR